MGPRSLRSRVLLSASLVLLLFLTGAGVLLERAFRESALNAVDDRLRGRIFMLVGAANFDATPGRPLVTDVPDPSLALPGSGNYARIFSDSGGVRWESASLTGVKLGEVIPAEPGTWRFDRIRSAGGERLFSLVYTIIWEGEGDQVPQKFSLQACENEALFLSTVGDFRRSLWLWLAGLSITLLLVQGLNLSAGLEPLKRVDEEVRAIESGSSERIAGSYPAELTSLTGNLNRLIAHNRDSLRRYRNALGDLAHSIKTPLAILRNELGSGSRTALDQLERIDRTVEYHLQRAATAGRALLAPPVAVAPVVTRIVDSLKKVHAARELEFEVDVEPGCVFRGDEGDLFEIVGNLADNAAKWARSRVALRVRGQAGRDDPARYRLSLEVADDGPGIPAGQVDLLLRRGARVDESVEGHGIGLAIVREMVEDVYGGRLSFEVDGGTRARVEIDAA